MTETQITPTQKIVAEVFAKATHQQDLDAHSEANFCKNAKQAIIDAGLTVSDDDDLLIGFFAMGLKRAVAKEATEETAQADTGLGGLDLLGKLDAIDVKAVKPTAKQSKIPQEDRAVIAEILDKYMVNFTPMLAEYNCLFAKETTLLASNEPTQFSGTLQQARMVFGQAIDDLHERVASDVTHYFTKKYSVKTLDTKKIHPWLGQGDKQRKWSTHGIAEKVKKGTNVHPYRVTPFEIDEVLHCIEAQLGTLDFGDLAIQEIFDIFHKKMGTDGNYQRGVDLPKKKNFSKTVKVDFWSAYAWDSWIGRPELRWDNRDELQNLTQVLRIFETDSQSVEPLTLLDERASLPTETLDTPEDWKLVKKIKFFKNGAIGITFKDGHTAARFVREICKRRV